MTIHHDKLAYGRLKGLREELSEDELLASVRALNEETDEESADESKKGNPNADGEDKKTSK